MNALPTPAMIVDETVVRRNISRLAQYAAEHRLGVRPHTKTHKSRRLAQLQLESGAVGLTAAKVGEAEVMSEVGDDILLAYPAVDPARTQRIARLARTKTVRVAIDSAYAASVLSEAASEAGSTIGILVDLDVGMGRTGVQSAEESVALAQAIERSPGLRLDGILCYPGHIAVSAETQRDVLSPVSARLREALDLWRSHGLEASIVSGGSTPTLFQSHLVPEFTEIRPGTYVYYDMNNVRGGFCRLEDCAARITCTVVSTAVPGQFVIDAGSKTLTSDRSSLENAGFGYVMEYPDARIVKLTEEHGQVDVRESASRPQVGDRVTVIPNHICPCVNLQDAIWWRTPSGEIEPLPIDARGRLS